MIPFEIQGVMVEEPKYDNNYVKFLIEYKNEGEQIGTKIPVCIFRNKFRLDYVKGRTYIVKGGFDSIPSLKKGYFLVYNAQKISMIEE